MPNNFGMKMQFNLNNTIKPKQNSIVRPSNSKIVINRNTKRTSVNPMLGKLFSHADKGGGGGGGCGCGH